MRPSLLVLIFLVGTVGAGPGDELVSRVDPAKYSIAGEVRYLLYDVNYGEGFNLRRDVHMRIAIAVKKMREEGGQNVVLILPPWGALHHWTDQRTGIAWSEFFDVDSLNRYTPVLEFAQFVEARTGAVPIDRVLYLQHFAEGWGEEYVMKTERRTCNEDRGFYREQKDGTWRGWFFGFLEVAAMAFECVSFQGDSGILASLIIKNYTDSAIFVDRAETVLHEAYGEREYWRARRAMRYARRLEDRARSYRAEVLGADGSDDTILPDRWEDEQPKRTTRGGPYVCAHWRRRDFVRAHNKELPSVEGAGKQIRALAKEFDVGKVFLATDASQAEIDELRGFLGMDLFLFRAGPDQELSDGAAAIVEQIICAGARAFTGSHVSTFSYRIQEDREIRGFPVETTFRRMCPDDNDKCEQPAKWKIQY